MEAMGARTGQQYRPSPFSWQSFLIPIIRLHSTSAPLHHTSPAYRYTPTTTSLPLPTSLAKTETGNPLIAYNGKPRTCMRTTLHRQS